MIERKFSIPSKLIDLEAVIDTRTPVWDIGNSGDVRIKLDTDVNGQTWYVLSNDSRRGGYFKGKVECWAFPHWCGSHDTYAYEPVAFCFKTFAELLETHPTELAIWGYDVAEYAERLRWKKSEQAARERGILSLFGGLEETGSRPPPESLEVTTFVPEDEPGIDEYERERRRHNRLNREQRELHDLLGDLEIDP